MPGKSASRWSDEPVTCHRCGGFMGSRIQEVEGHGKVRAFWCACNPTSPYPMRIEPLHPIEAAVIDALVEAVRSGLR